jgi:hypothetical protein
VSRPERWATRANELDLIGSAPEHVVGVPQDLPWSGDVEQIRAGHGEEPDALLGASHESSVFLSVLKCNHMAMSAIRELDAGLGIEMTPAELIAGALAEIEQAS